MDDKPSEAPCDDEGRILFSNDHPHENYAEGGEFIDTVPIAESDRCKIACENAKALCKLQEGARVRRAIKGSS